MRELVLDDYNHSGASCLSSHVGHDLIAPLRAATGLVLSPLTMLHTIVIVFGPASRAHGSLQEPDLWPPLLRMLGTASSPSLERLLIMPDRPSPRLASKIDWRALRAACKAFRVRSPRLRVVLGLGDYSSLYDLDETK
jgi:hypothetical protein